MNEKTIHTEEPSACGLAAERHSSPVCAAEGGILEGVNEKTIHTEEPSACGLAAERHSSPVCAAEGGIVEGVNEKTIHTEEPSACGLAAERHSSPVCAAEGGIVEGVNEKTIHTEEPSAKDEGRAAMYKNCMKRLLDILLSGLGLLCLSPVIAVTAVLVRIKLGSPVIFRQERPGYREKLFTLCKFRTMTDAKDASGELLPDSVRLTKFGSFLRSTSLDELPELWNILKGEMSLIGPRPLLISYLPYYTKKEKLRHTVRPGLTGLAQVSGRNYIEWDKRLAKDVEYVKSLTFGLDVRILLLTVKTVFAKEDVAVDTDIVEGNLAEIREAERSK